MDLPSREIYRLMLLLIFNVNIYFSFYFWDICAIAWDNLRLADRCILKFQAIIFDDTNDDRPLPVRPNRLRDICAIAGGDWYIWIQGSQLSHFSARTILESNVPIEKWIFFDFGYTRAILAKIPESIKQCTGMLSPHFGFPVKTTRRVSKTHSILVVSSFFPNFTKM
jgi:hypothetical protein